MHRTRWWDLALAAICVAAAVQVIGLHSVGGLGIPEAACLAGVILAFALAYALLARPELGLPLGPYPAWRRVTYSTVAVALLLCAVSLHASMATLQAFIYPVVWVMSPTKRGAVIWSVLVAASVLFGNAIDGDFSAAAWGEGALVAAISLAFAIAMGLWITRIMEYSEERAKLLEDLTAAQERLVALERERGAADERERLSRDIHDTLAQTLAGLVMLAERARREAGPGSPALTTIGNIGRLTREAHEEARQVVARNAALPTGAALDAALERLAERFRGETGLSAAVRASGDLEQLDRESQVVVLRFVQEGLSNVRKHAEAGRVVVRVVVEADGAAVAEVRDDGRGFDPNETRTGFGLDGMGERLALAGGTLAVDSRPGKGTVLTATLPAPQTGETPE